MRRFTDYKKHIFEDEKIRDLIDDIESKEGMSIREIRVIESKVKKWDAGSLGSKVLIKELEKFKGINV